MELPTTMVSLVSVLTTNPLAFMYYCILYLDAFIYLIITYYPTYLPTFLIEVAKFNPKNVKFFIIDLS